MEINTYTPVKTNHRLKACVFGKGNSVDETRHADASSNEALGSYGIAALGINTGTAVLSKGYTPPQEYTPLTDEEFEVFAKKIEDKINSLPDEIKKYFDISFITKDNIFIFDKVLSEEKLYGDKRALAIAFNAASALENNNYAPELKNKLANKLLSDEKFYGNDQIAENSIFIILSAISPEKYEFEEKMLSDDTLCNEIFLKEFLFDSLEFIPDETVSAMNDFTGRVLKNPERFTNDKIRDNLIYIYKHTPEKTEIMSELLDKGAGFNEAFETIHDKEKYDELKESLENPNSLRKLICSEDYDKKIKKAAQGKYTENLIEVFNKDTISYDTIKKLCSELDEKDFLSGIKKIATSTYKLAMKTPNRYLSNISKKYTTEVNGTYPKLTEEELETQQKQITEFFKANSGKMIRALKYIDTDTLNQAADRRTVLFEKTLAELDELTAENYELLSTLTKCKNGENGKILTAKDKTELCRIVEIFQKGKIDNKILQKYANKGEVNIPEIKKIIQKEVIKQAGITEEMLDTIPDDKLKFNEEYAYLTLLNGSVEDLINNISGTENTEAVFSLQMSIMREMSDEELKNSTTNMEKYIKKQMLPEELSAENLNLIKMYKHLDKYSDAEIWEQYKKVNDLTIAHNANSEIMFTVIRESILGDFKSFISNPENIYGETNEKTKQAFTEAGLDYNKWLSPKLPDCNFDIDGKKVTLKLWERNPQEDLYLGNKTTCCTAIGTGINQSTQPIFLLNTAFNVVEMYDEEENVVGMSRAFVGKVNGENALLIDNIELNNNFTKNMPDEDKKEIRNRFFDYMSNYGKAINGGENMNLYFCPRDVHVPTGDMKKISSVTEFTGKISQPKVYINSVKCTWVDPDKLPDEGKIEWLEVPQNADAA